MARIDWHDLPPDYSRGTVDGRDCYIIQAVALSVPTPFVGLETLRVGGRSPEKLLGYSKHMSTAKKLAEDDLSVHSGQPMGAREAPFETLGPRGRFSRVMEGVREAGPGGALDWEERNGRWVARSIGGVRYEITQEDSEYHVWRVDRGGMHDVAKRGSLGGAFAAAARDVNVSGGMAAEASMTPPPEFGPPEWPREVLGHWHTYKKFQLPSEWERKHFSWDNTLYRVDAYVGRNQPEGSKYPEIYAVDATSPQQAEDIVIEGWLRKKYIGDWTFDAIVKPWPIKNGVPEAISPESIVTGERGVEEGDPSAMGEEVGRGAREAVPVVHEAPANAQEEDFATQSGAERWAYSQGDRFISGEGKNLFVYRPVAKGYERRVIFKRQGNWHRGRRKKIVTSLPTGVRTLTAVRGEAAEATSGATEEARVTYKQRQNYPPSAFALPRRRQLIIKDKAHIGPAASRLAMMRNEGHITKAEYSAAHKRIVRAGKKFGVAVREVREAAKKGFAHAAYEATHLRLIKGGGQHSESLDQFTQAYVTAALWSTPDDSGKGEMLDENYGINDLAPSTLAAMKEDCEKFQRDNADLLEKAQERGFGSGSAGHDFWLTRNHHGAGFWDRDALSGRLGKQLTEAANRFDEFELYVGDDGKIYALGHERDGRHGMHAVTEARAGESDHVHDLTDQQLEVLFDVEKPHRQRKLPQPQASVAYDRAYKDLSDGGYITWKQVNANHQSLADDHYELTAKGRDAIRERREWIRRIGGRSEEAGSDGVSLSDDNLYPSDEDGNLGEVFKWLTRNDMGMHFPGTPIGWYQNHQINAIDVIKEKIATVAPGASNRVRVRGGMLEVKDASQWIPLGLTTRQVYDEASSRSRGGTPRALEANEAAVRRATEAQEGSGPKAAEAAAEQSATAAEGDCVPFVKMVRAENFACGMERAKKIGPIDTPQKVWELVHSYTDREDTEIFLVVMCDVHGQCRGVAEVARGQRSRVGVGVNDILRTVLASGCEMFFVIHDHPSSSARPSEADRQLTKDIEKACEPYSGEIFFADHLVLGVGSGEVFSIRENKLYKFGQKSSRKAAADA